MPKDQTNARPQAAFEPFRNHDTNEAMAEALRALSRVGAAGQAMLDAVEGSALPAIEVMIAQAEAMAGDRRLSPSVRSRLDDLKAQAERLKTTLSGLASAA